MFLILSIRQTPFGRPRRTPAPQGPTWAVPIWAALHRTSITAHIFGNASCLLRDAPPASSATRRRRRPGARRPRVKQRDSTAREEKHASLLPFQSFYQSNRRVRKRGRRFCGGERWPGREARVCSRQRRRRPRDPPTRTRTRRRRPCPAPLAPGSRVLSMKENNRTELTLVIRSSNMISLGQHHHWKTTNVLMVTPFSGLTLPEI
ncbi:uncharacterized protein [Lolium perenne]|uniref:uncharacterized protein n=1 Tax=Lolium perenne TaxID=4522 RepID=UPI003A994836